MNKKLDQYSHYLSEEVATSSVILEKEIIADLTLNSSNVKKNAIFFALKGATTHGIKYIDQAIKSGAIAVVLDSKEKHLVDSESYPMIYIDNLKDKIPDIACEFYKAKPEKLVGITGTNGKTTSALLMHQALTFLNKKSSYIGTLSLFQGATLNQNCHTTPDIFLLHKMISESQGNYIMLEVSSHGIEQGRVSGLDFHTKIFTNLSQDHLDYHGTMEAYRAIKRSFLISDTQSNLVLDITEELSKELIKKDLHNIITFGLDVNAMIMGSIAHQDLEGQLIEVTYQNKSDVINTKLIGDFNAKNILSALGGLVSLGEDFNKSCEALSTVKQIEGRTNQFILNKNTRVMVDYAHTPDALEKVLFSLSRLIRKNKIITVLGCGGERDKQKRPIMAGIAEYYSNHVVLTNDNPRKEEPASIIDDMLRGASNKKNFTTILDRADAIDYAIDRAEGGMILLAGKGHEQFQDLGTEVKHFCDLEYIKGVIAND